MGSWFLAALLGWSLLAGCARTAPPAPPGPTQPEPPPAPSQEVPAGPGSEPARLLVAALADPQEPELPPDFRLPPPLALRVAAPAMCPREPLSKRDDPSCADPETARDRLAAALEESQPASFAEECVPAWAAEAHAARVVTDAKRLRERDRRLAAVEACRGVPPSLVRLARAALWPACADALAESALAGAAPATEAAPRIPPEFQVALRGYSIAAQVSRLEFDPRWRPPANLGRALELLEKQFLPWLKKHDGVLRTALEAVQGLPDGSHGRSVALLALSNTYERLLYTRLEPPDVIKSDRASREQFHDRARTLLSPFFEHPVVDTATTFTAANVIADWSLLRAWASGRQTRGAEDLIRQLVLPPMPVLADGTGRDARLAASLPSYVVVRLIPLDGMQGGVLRGFVLRGFDPKLRRWAAAREFSGADAEIVAHARLVLSARALEPSHAIEAERLLGPNPPSDEAAFLSGLASALGHMPAREGWLVADAAGDADLGPLDALSNRREVSASVRALAAYAGWLFSDMRTPRQLDHTKREERAFQLLRNLGPPLRECIPSGVVMDGLCPCPKLGWL